MPTKTKATKKPERKRTVKQAKLLAKLPQITYDDFVGQGEDLWKSDAELDQFLSDIQQRRREKE
jgi:hypothetical protein